MNGRRRLFHRLLSGFMAVLLIVCMMPQSVMMVKAATTTEVQVFGENNTPLDGATVRIYKDADDETGIEGTAAGNGTYKFVSDNPDGYKGCVYEVTCDGYQGQKGNILENAYYNAVHLTRASVNYSFQYATLTVTMGDNTQINVASNGDDIAMHYAAEPEIASIGYDGKINPKKKGTATVTAYNEVDAEVATYTLIVKGKPQAALSWDTLSDTTTPWNAEPFSLKVKGGTTNGDIDYKLSGDTGIAEIDEENETISFKQSGKVGIIAVMDGGNDYEDAETPEVTFTVETIDQDGLIFSENTPTELDFNQSRETVEATTDPEKEKYSTGSITYKSNDPLKLAVDAVSGLLTTNGVGTVTITATKAGDGQYNPVDATIDITVNPIDEKDVKFQTKQNDVPQLECFGTYSNVIINTTRPVTYFTDDKDIVSVNEATGEVTGKSVGTATIQAKVAKQGNYNEQVTVQNLTKQI